MDLHKTILDGERARQLIQDETLGELFDRLRSAYVESWTNTDPIDVEGRERLYMAVQVLEHVRTNLRVLAEAGKLATAQIERLKNRRGLQ